VLRDSEELKVCAHKLLIGHLTVYKCIKHTKQSWITEFVVSP